MSGGQASTGRAPATRILYCISGVWTDAWYDDPGAWWQWCCAFRDWTPEQWVAFSTRWHSASRAWRERLMAEHGLYFFNWSRVPGGSIRGSARAAGVAIEADLAGLAHGSDVTLLGHSKGGNAVKHLLGGGGALPARAVLIDAPLDWLRETASRLMGLGIEPCRLTAKECPVPCVTINNWLDPSGGRLSGLRNYQTLVWQDYLNPYPPHGMKGFLAQRVLQDMGAIPPVSSASGVVDGAPAGANGAAREPAGANAATGDEVGRQGR